MHRFLTVLFFCSLFVLPSKVISSWHFGDPIASVKDQQEIEFRRNITSVIFQASEVERQFDLALRDNSLEKFHGVRDEYVKFVASLYKLPESTQILLRSEIIRAGRTYALTFEKIDALTKKEEN